MELSIEDKFYAILFVNVLPGLLATLEIILFFELCSPGILTIIVSKLDILMKFNYLIALILIIFIIGAFLGLIIDGIRHFIYRDFINRMDVIAKIKNRDQLEIYRHFCNAYWYPYEATGNIGITMIPGAILLLIFLIKRLEIDFTYKAVLFCSYIFITVIMINISKKFLEKTCEVEESFLESIGSDQNTSAEK